MGGWGDGGGIELVGGKGHSFDGGHSFFFFFFSFCTLAIFSPPFSRPAFISVSTAFTR
jgi:hypothetical protein